MSPNIRAKQIEMLALYAIEQKTPRLFLSVSMFSHQISLASEQQTLKNNASFVSQGYKSSTVKPRRFDITERKLKRFTAIAEWLQHFSPFSFSLFSNRAHVPTSRRLLRFWKVPRVSSIVILVPMCVCYRGFGKSQTLKICFTVMINIP